MISGGSDFHGNPERKNQMGICINHDGYIPKELLDTWKKDKTKQLIKQKNKKINIKLNHHFIRLIICIYKMNVGCSG